MGELKITNPDEICDCGNRMAKVSDKEEVWYCNKCDVEYRINDDGSKNVIYKGENQNV